MELVFLSVRYIRIYILLDEFNLLRDTVPLVLIVAKIRIIPLLWNKCR
ncbi:unnamed protein product [Phytomonas sp. Hart1]|nr:unnamed protein product [Phytomonas sp. Hart1]|eukprot:CCW66270.1 unnamed protein product [Phytomonas sp. isolate Hart1]